MFEIKVYNLAPDRMKTMGFWCRFFVGTHWRKLVDNAEIKIDTVDLRGSGEMECTCKQVNSKYSLGGFGLTKVRDFPMDCSMIPEHITLEAVARHKFLLVPDTILVSGYGEDNQYRNNMRSTGWDPSLRAPDFACELKGETNGRRNEPIALFSHGIPVGQIITVKGLVIGNLNDSRFMYDHSYYWVR